VALNDPSGFFSLALKNVSCFHLWPKRTWVLIEKELELVEVIGLIRFAGSSSA
jgi:hypothetical protein